MRGIILYGAPAAGKDTVTAALHDLDSAYVLFPRLKAGPGRTTGYRMTEPARLDEMRQAGDLIWENQRYGARYAVDRRFLLESLRSQVPVVHLGQPEAVDALTEHVAVARWLVVSLRCSREITRTRLLARGSTDVADRLRAWDETRPLSRARLTIDTALTDPANAARQIHAASLLVA